MAGESRLLVRAHVAAESAGRPRLDVDLDFSAGITAVMGPSGAGKSTLLTTIAGLAKPDSGRIELCGTVLFDSNRRTFVPAHKRRVALVFQTLALFPHLLVWQNVAYGLPANRKGHRRDRALIWLDRARVSHLVDRAPSSLSGGEAQRVAIARALASEPRALLLDEPFSAVDSGLRRDLGTDLRTLVEETGIVAILVTHHSEDATSLSSRLIVLDEGRSVENKFFKAGDGAQIPDRRVALSGR